MSDTKRIGLADFLEALRAEFDDAKARLTRSGKEPLLNLGGVEIEIQFVVEREAKGGVGVDVGLFAVEAGGKYHSENIHKVKVKLIPQATSVAAVAGSGSGE